MRGEGKGDYRGIGKGERIRRDISILCVCNGIDKRGPNQKVFPVAVVRMMMRHDIVKDRTSVPPGRGNHAARYGRGVGACSIKSRKEVTADNDDTEV